MAFPPKSSGGSNDRGATPEQNPNVQTGAAPAGKTFGSDLPVKNSPRSATTGGYRPNNDRG